MIYLSDNDVVEKLAICDLLDDALAAFSATRDDVMVVPTLKYRVGLGSPRPKIVRRLGIDAANRLCEFVGAVKEIREYSAEDHQFLESLDESVEIDPGEIVLLSATAGLTNYRLLTGDERCLRAVATHPECAKIARRIQGRVVCFEQIICRIIDHQGFESVRAKVAPGDGKYCDTALRAAFGSGMDATEINALACLRSYITEIRRFPVDLLEPDQ